VTHVLTPDVRFEGWTSDDWMRFTHLWQPRATAERESTRPRGGIIAIHDGRRVRKLLHTGKGRVDLPTTPWPLPLPDLAGEHGASWALSAHAGALDEIMERFGARARRGQDAVEQALDLVAIARVMIQEGAIDHWPRRLRGIPVPSEGMVRRAMDAVCPAGSALCLGMFQGGELWTAFIARRRGANFDVIAGPDELRREMGLLAGDWRRDYRHLVRAVEERYAPLAFGCFAEVETFRSLQVDGRAGAWARAMLVRDVVLSPIPVAVGLALGADGARFAFEHVRIITNRLDPFGFLDPVLRGVRARLGSAAGDKDVAGTLGFDPMAALRALLKR
jgi:hypothetical protein